MLRQLRMRNYGKWYLKPNNFNYHITKEKPRTPTKEEQEIAFKERFNKVIKDDAKRGKEGDMSNPGRVLINLAAITKKMTC